MVMTLAWCFVSDLGAASHRNVGGEEIYLPSWRLFTALLLLAYCLALPI